MRMSLAGGRLGQYPPDKMADAHSNTSSMLHTFMYSKCITHPCTFHLYILSSLSFSYHRIFYFHLSAFGSPTQTSFIYIYFFIPSIPLQPLFFSISLQLSLVHVYTFIYTSKSLQLDESCYSLFAFLLVSSPNLYLSFYLLSLCICVGSSLYLQYMYLLFTYVYKYTMQF